MIASKLLNGISLKQDDRKYNPAKVFIDLDNLDASDQEETPIQLSAKSIAEVTPKATVYQTMIKKLDNLDMLCTCCIESKLTRVVRRNKSMTAMIKKLEEIHADF